MESENAASTAGTAGTEDGSGGRFASALAACVSGDSGRSPAVSLCLSLSRNISEYLGIFPKKSLPESEMTGPLSPV